MFRVLEKSKLTVMVCCTDYSGNSFYAIHFFPLSFLPFYKRFYRKICIFCHLLLIPVNNALQNWVKMCEFASDGHILVGAFFFFLFLSKTSQIHRHFSEYNKIKKEENMHKYVCIILRKML